MNKQELAVVSLLFALLIGWGMFQGWVRQQHAGEAPVPAVASANATGDVSQVESATSAVPPAASEQPVLLQADTATNRAPEAHAVPERCEVLANGETSVEVSSWGGGIASVELPQYRETVEKDSPPLRLRFAPAPALAYRGISGLTVDSDFALSRTGDTVLVSRALPGGVTFIRSISLHAGYRLSVVDSFSNTTAQAVTIPEHSVASGPMAKIFSKYQMQGISYLGVDTLLTHGGKGVKFWGGDLPALFGARSSGCSSPDTRGMQEAVTQRTTEPVSWVAVKNQFFANILTPEGGAADCEIHAERDMSDPKVFNVGVVSAALVFPAAEIAPGSALVRNMDYYVGPKKHVLLRDMGNRQDDIMEFGWFEWFRAMCRLLLWTLNALYSVIPNYGVAIILLTAIVRIVFWPVTHKSTESMKKMQQMQPLVNEIRQKYKDKPQKMNQEVMDLYKKHKVNPMAGCLPMLIQIPVFIALYVMLRSAVELRFAEFLWIRDLSEPEQLFAGVLPIPLNILPILMTVTMVWQQKLTPTVGDPQQQKIMALMPVIMLFVLYNIASGLVLYWTISQCLSIVQLLWQRRNAPAADAAARA